MFAPPRDEKKIRNLGEHGDPELYELSPSALVGFESMVRWGKDDGDWKEFAKGLPAENMEQLERSLPFDRQYQVSVADAERQYANYFEAASAWRRMDADWLAASAEFGLQLDNVTNNTSLVLAFEVGEDGPVILMAADAQLGSWLSWHDYTWSVPSKGGRTRSVTAKDLLARTVIYKVGHHGSHNATAVEHGLEQMESKSLVALIPVDGVVATNKEWSMPAGKLYQRLMAKAAGRVVCSDVGLPQ